MRFRLSATIAAALLCVSVSQPQAAMAFGANPAVEAPRIAETVACRVVRERVDRPGGRTIYRTSRVCDDRLRFDRPRFGGGCRVERERVVRPNGSVVYRTTRRC